MNKENIREPLEVDYQKMKVWPNKKIKTTFFQMMYIVSGSGSIRINGNLTAYRNGSLLLITPNDSYTFGINESTEFLFIKFSSSYVQEFTWKHLDCLECLLHYAPSVSGCVMKNEADIQLARTIATSLLNEIAGPKGPYTVDLTRHFVNALIVIAARNISLVNPANLRPNSDKRVQDVIHYIQANINTPHRLKTTQIANHFGVAATYFGTYFKAQCGETYQQFITHYKLRLIEHRLRFSDKRINEIADEFGFSDESHLNKFFKKHKGLNLSAFRRSSVNTHTSSSSSSVR